jgi:membrane protein implicated in regulation of membrane protease activity
MDFPAWQVWLILGIVLWIAEVFAPSFIPGLLGLGCLAAAAIAALGHDLVYQLLAFGASALYLFVGVRPFVMRHLHREDDAKRTNVEAVVGKAGTVVEPHEEDRPGGRVKVAGEEWRARVDAGPALVVGSRVVVERVEGCTVVVRPEAEL